MNEKSSLQSAMNFKCINAIWLQRTRKKCFLSVAALQHDFRIKCIQDTIGYKSSLSHLNPSWDNVLSSDPAWTGGTNIPPCPPPTPQKRWGRDLRTIKWAPFSLYWKNKRATEFTALEEETAIVFAQKSWEAKQNQSESRLNKNNQKERS